ncbi:DNA-directed RNA polymerase sigma-70 factor [Marivirga lumbricoides]|uniref:DNA-directed RNA polymerase sigma-70 factor n=1 Tax=Marivirga lumbricoides TaxID=1046115 RepID=A0ABQ1MK84_9BACT|nr:DNA-directed RNA polymerase sigma-70 factor [Marivirga lumbricoides]
MNDQGEISDLLIKANEGDLNAYNKIFPLVYNELRQIAHRIRYPFVGLDTFNTTAIVHEAYLKLIQSEADWKDKAHFSCVAAKAMRQLLLNAARSKKTEKRGGNFSKVSFDDLEEQISLSEKCSNEILHLEDALILLGQKSEEQMKLVECRFFANMSIEETAEALSLSTSTVKRHWNVVKVWLYSQIQQQKLA